MSVCILAAILFQAYMATRCPSGLGMEALLAGQAWTHGVMPYRDFHMHVGPLVPSLFAILFAIPPLAWCSLVFGFFNLLTAFGIYRLMTRYRQSPSLLASGLFLFIIPWFDGNALHVETIMTTFGVWAFYFYDIGSPVSMAVMLFLAMATKQTGLTYTLALVPFLRRDEFLAAGTVFLSAGIIVMTVALRLNAWHPAIAQLSGWTLYHAVLDPWSPWSRTKLVVRACLPICAILWISRQVPKTWLLLVILFSVEFIIVPESHFLLAVMPFLCMLMAMAFFDHRPTPAWAIFLSGALLFFVFERSLPKLLNQSGLSRRSYGLMDSYYAAGVLAKSAPIYGPVWTNWPDLYYVMDWPVPGNDFLAQIEGVGGALDWTKEPYRSANTRIYLSRGASDFQNPVDGTWKDYPLNRGQYHWMRVWKRNN